MRKKEKTVAKDVRGPDRPSTTVNVLAALRSANSSRPLSDVTNLLSSKTHADSPIERDNRVSTLASMTRIRHTFNFCKNSTSRVENVRLDESHGKTRRSIEECSHDRIRDA